MGYGLVNGFIDTYHSELQVITTLLLISTLHKSPQCLLTLFQPTISSPAVLWQWLLTVEILQLQALRSSCHCRPCRTLVNYSTISFQLPLQSSTDSLPPVLFFINPRCESCRKHPISNSTSIVACVFISTGICLPSHCSETAICLFAYCIAMTVLVVCFEVFA
jgi:hypothetical protein